MDRNKTKISKYLTKILRHSAGDACLFIDEHGWVDLDQLIAHMRSIPSLDGCLVRAVLACNMDGTISESDVREVAPLSTKDLILSIVDDDEKGRFELSTLKTMIRATQGHSITKVDPDLRLIGVEEGSSMTAIHGTTSTNLSKITAANGVSRMKRNNIHMIGTPPEKGKVKSGYRPSCDRLIWINVPEAMRQGIKFYQSKNDVILSQGNADGKIPADCFLKITEV
jgi:2'-phosphotransferase